MFFRLPARPCHPVDEALVSLRQWRGLATQKDKAAAGSYHRSVRVILAYGVASAERSRRGLAGAKFDVGWLCLQRLCRLSFPAAECLRDCRCRL